MSYAISYKLSWIWSISKGYRASLLLYFILELLVISLSLNFIYWSKKAIDIAMKAASGNLTYAIYIIVISIASLIVLSSISSYINERVRLKLGVSFQNKLVKQQMLSQWQAIKNWHTGDIQVRLNTDSVEVVNMITTTGISVILTAIKLLSSFLFLWFMDPQLAYIILGLSPLLLLSKFYFKKMKRLSAEIKERESSLGKVVQENLRFRLLIRGMNLFPSRWSNYEEIQQGLFNKRIEQQDFSIITQVIMKFSMNIGYLTTFIWGVYRLQAGQISFGTMTAFLQLIGRIQSPFLQLVGFLPVFIRFRTSIDRLLDLEHTNFEIQKEGYKIESIDSVVISNLYFSYEQQEVIQNFNAIFEKNKPTAIVGTSGQGKTTLIRLLLALVKFNSGNIFINSNGEKLLLSTEHRTNFIYVPQGNTLFSGSILENLKAADSLASESKLHQALITACAEFVFDLPAGINTVIGESAHGLSEGQAQRIAIARGLLQNGKIWLLDEITSALDKQTRKKLITNLLLAGKDKVLIFVTHDKELSEQCSQTIYMK
ncbi:ABC transporter ATP-binding protein [Sphingobacteriaceae bacterium WQ 2009]|uniref:ABC transporter ATP-binding protein n=1 Tax=Rhinopithecimicrobium faecis TaxID=2820698 RepID=A0A8T4H575_9SPHI|nr:ABC transporter ATP-binding protein [Sphingobacteriaceae bacterium WQ 2009]